MAGVPWIRISTSMFEDEKVKLIQALPEGDTLVVIWIRLLTMAGKTNDNGYIYLSEGTPYTPQMLSVIMNKPQPVMDLALRTFTDFQMIEVDEKGICILNWEKHQNIEGLEKIRKQTKERVKRYRERKKKEQLLLPKGKSQNEDCNVTGNATETPGNAIDKEEDRDKEKERDRREKENLCFKEDIEAFVETQMASNPLLVSPKLLVKYIDCIRLTRKTTRISRNIVLKLWEKWQQYSPAVVTYAMWVHVEKHDDKREEYTLGIMRGTDEHEANRKLIMLKNRRQPAYNQPPSRRVDEEEPEVIRRIREMEKELQAEG
ncbi:hypothetical protein GCM10011571_17480 [Marinithermofilum abyssi]|uniref:Phage replisome organiser N-terminal domain-containing protein n=1 Tax=Marinithermofilum abyssi TaxID=1571185 RepID=A0A8J2VII3_9BACL|nr:phage replisome organizer N-terminal domain-containing protein [Marinithermofilum abyssi]GGE16318.1 hypothetical protein GCM10011571_17480 [Marinithermofilum abyssi]